MTARATEALRAADTVCAEDTRVTGKLLAALGMKGKRLERLDENVVGKRAAGIVGRVLSGESIAYCSDAGMPGISDPGMRLVRAAREAGAPVEVLPGPTAVAAAYVASGCTSSAFYFGGFLPRKDTARTQLLETLKPLDAALIFYESPKRLLQTLKSIRASLPLRRCAVCRELTKLHEEVLCGTAGELFGKLEARDSIKGEIVIVIDGPPPEEREGEAGERLERAAKRAGQLGEDGMRPKEIGRTLTEEFGVSRNQAYRLALDAVGGAPGAAD